MLPMVVFSTFIGAALMASISAGQQEIGAGPAEQAQIDGDRTLLTQVSAKKWSDVRPNSNLCFEWRCLRGMNLL
jgi:hypothetical protein